jgi:asparagine synthase (glutamine-hydrolysing)
MGSPEGEYFLRRSLFLPRELSSVMGVEQAREGLQRLGGSPPGMMGTGAPNTEAAVCMLDSTLYLRNMLLRDSDWTSMAHSLELRTPFVDAALLRAMSPIHASFSRGAGKRMLSKSPLIPLPDHIMNRPKTGFTVPMAQWLALATEHRDWNQSPILAPRATPWTRRWAAVVADSFFQSASQKRALPEAC